MNKYIIHNPGDLHAMLNNQLYGAKLALSCHGHSLRVIMASPKQILFECNSPVFVSAFRVEISNYGLEMPMTQ